MGHDRQVHAAPGLEGQDKAVVEEWLVAPGRPDSDLSAGLREQGQTQGNPKDRSAPSISDILGTKCPSPPALPGLFLLFHGLSYPQCPRIS